MKINIKEGCSYELTSDQSEVKQEKKEKEGKDWELEDTKRYDDTSQAERYKVLPS